MGYDYVMLAQIASAQAVSARAKDQTSKFKDADQHQGSLEVDGHWQVFVDQAAVLAAHHQKFGDYFEWVRINGGWQTFQAMQQSHKLLYGQVSSDKFVVCGESIDKDAKAGLVFNDNLVVMRLFNSMDPEAATCIYLTTIINCRCQLPDRSPTDDRSKAKLCCGHLGQFPGCEMLLSYKGVKTISCMVWSGCSCTVHSNLPTRNCGAPYQPSYTV